MNTAEQHYQRLLAEHYTWMLGDDIEQTARDQKTLIEALMGTAPREAGGTAIDLGCGSGAQTLALADLGFTTVLGVDTDETLLAELRSHAVGRPTVRTLREDAVTAVSALPERSVDVCVCMGDTLLHLPGAEAVTELVTGVARALAPGGMLLLTYRDLSNALHGVDRAIPVRSTDDRIMLCFLDFTHVDVVDVHDIVYTRTPHGWDVAKSSYPKLRLSPQWVTDQLAAAGLVVEHHEHAAAGTWRTVAHRRPDTP